MLSKPDRKNLGIIEHRICKLNIMVGILEFRLCDKIVEKHLFHFKAVFH